ncbi:MAG: hypothetical protein JWN86_4476 [Planctomycetota bacterium]|nr:hypothetical protein [Planctomycetota bacterium]
MRLFCLAAALAVGMFAPADPKPNDSTLNAKPPEGAKVLFNGKSLEGWIHRDGKPASWPVSDGVFTVGPKTGDIMTKDKFDGFKLHLEFNVPYMPKATGQGRGNSGVYLAGLYELQVLDSYGLKPQDNDCGAIYKQVIPKFNACKPPLQWQTYDVTLHKAKYDGDKLVKKTRLTVVQNGITIIDDAEIVPCPANWGGKESEPGPLLLQDHGNDVQYRNIWIVPLNEGK